MYPHPQPTPPSPLATQIADQQPHQIKLDQCVQTLSKLCDQMHSQCEQFRRQMQFRDFAELNRTRQQIVAKSREWAQRLAQRSEHPENFAVLQLDHSEWLQPELAEADREYRRAVDLCIWWDGLQQEEAERAARAERKAKAAYEQVAKSRCRMAFKEFQPAVANLGGEVDCFSDKVSYAAVRCNRNTTTTTID